MRLMKTLEDEIFEEIDKLGYFDFEPKRWSKFTDIIFKLEKENKIISLDKIDATTKFMNASYIYTYFNNRYNLTIKKLNEYSNVYGLVKGNEQ